MLLLLEEKRLAVIQEIREGWNRIKDISRADLQFQILADDSATNGQWLEAAEALVTLARYNPALPNAKRPMLGESLRSRKQPGVSDLLAQRAEQVTAGEQNSSVSIHRLGVACKITLCHANWDISSVLPAIRKRIAEVQEIDNNESLRFYAADLHRSLSRMIMTAVDQGATDLLDDYVAWIRPLRPIDADRFVYDQFRPLARYPDDKRLLQLSEEIFSRSSPWYPLYDTLGNHWSDGFSSSLIAVPAFRRLAIEELANQKLFGTGSLSTKTAMVSLFYSNASGIGVMGGFVETALDDEARQLQGKFPVRWCDLVAWKLSSLQGAPVYELWWNEPRRNTALMEMKRFLEHRGSAFRDRGDIQEDFIDSPARFWMANLSQPATAADVNAGKVIFSLEDVSSERRIVSLMNRPQPARWATLQQFPINRIVFQPERYLPPFTNTGDVVTAFDQTGVIWQAEEAKVDGRWQRYYGFVGRHIIARVPAEEIEFVAAGEP